LPESANLDSIPSSGLFLAFQIRYSAIEPFYGFQLDFTGPQPTASSQVGVDGDVGVGLGYAISIENGIIIGYSTLLVPIPPAEDELLLEFYYLNDELVVGSTVTIAASIASDIEGEELKSAILNDVLVLELGDDCPTAGTGDLNFDDAINVLDVVGIINIIIGITDIESLTECEFLSADVNMDAKIDVLDVVQVINTITG
jgi:hypothetical protein